MTKQLITGIGGVFFRAKNPKALAKWYDDNLGITRLSQTDHEPWDQAAGVKIDEDRQDADYGRFAWVYDPEGNKIEPWRPLG